MKRWLLLFLAWPALVPAQQEADLDATFDSTVLIIESAHPACFRLDIYLAITRPQRAQGLMFVRDLPDTTGMLFIYERDSILSIWMKNTFIPLDIVFVDSQGQPINTYANAQPQTTNSRPAAEPARYVLEVNGGMADRLGLTPDARLRIDLLEFAGN